VMANPPRARRKISTVTRLPASSALHARTEFAEEPATSSHPQYTGTLATASSMRWALSGRPAGSGSSAGMIARDSAIGTSGLYRCGLRSFPACASPRSGRMPTRSCHAKTPTSHRSVWTLVGT